MLEDNWVCVCGGGGGWVCMCVCVCGGGGGGVNETQWTVVEEIRKVRIVINKNNKDIAYGPDSAKSCPERLL